MVINTHRGRWRRYWFVLPTAAFVGFAAWALFFVRQDTRAQVIPLGTGGVAEPPGDSSHESVRDAGAGPDVEMPVYPPARVRKSKNKRGGPLGPRFKMRARRENTLSDDAPESELKIPCIFRDDCDGTDPDSRSRQGVWEEHGLKIPSVFEPR